MPCKFVSISPAPLAHVDGVEIFSTGEHHGKQYTHADLRRIVTLFYTLKTDIRPPVVIGHEEGGAWQESSGTPAYGVVSKLWTRGDVLMASFSEMPPVLAKAINDRRFRQVSVELYDSFGDIAGPVLRRVAILGGELPEVKSLAELPLACFAEAKTAAAARATFLRRFLQSKQLTPSLTIRTYSMLPTKFCERTEIVKVRRFAETHAQQLAKTIGWRTDMPAEFERGYKLYLRMHPGTTADQFLGIIPAHSR